MVHTGKPLSKRFPWNLTPRLLQARRLRSLLSLNKKRTSQETRRGEYLFDEPKSLR